MSKWLVCKIRKATEQMDAEEFDKITDRILQIRAERLGPRTPEREIEILAREVELLEQIQRKPDARIRKRYNSLKARRKRGLLNPDELQEMKDLYNQLEIQHSYRIGAVLELAEIRNKSLEEMMDELGLRTPPYE